MPALQKLHSQELWKKWIEFSALMHPITLLVNAALSIYVCGLKIELRVYSYTGLNSSGENLKYRHKFGYFHRLLNNVSEYVINWHVEM